MIGDEPSWLLYLEVWPSFLFPLWPKLEWCFLPLLLWCLPTWPYLRNFLPTPFPLPLHLTWRRWRPPRPTPPPTHTYFLELTYWWDLLLWWSEDPELFFQEWTQDPIEHDTTCIGQCPFFWDNDTPCCSWSPWSSAHLQVNTSGCQKKTKVPWYRVWLSCWEAKAGIT